MEPLFVTEPGVIPVLNELKNLEPIFHTSYYGNNRGELENVTDTAFWEVGASGRRYSREYIFGILKNRGITIEKSWQMKDLWCREIAADNYLLTYTLVQGKRVTRRSTLWRRTVEGWKILYHQGTIVQDE
jgi:hypothetical protein